MWHSYTQQPRVNVKIKLAQLISLSLKLMKCLRPKGSWISLKSLLTLVWELIYLLYFCSTYLLHLFITLLFLKIEGKVFVNKSQGFAEFFNKSPSEMYVLSLRDVWWIFPHIRNKQKIKYFHYHQSLHFQQQQQQKTESILKISKQWPKHTHSQFVGVKSIESMQRSSKALILAPVPSLQSCQDYVGGKKDIHWRHPWQWCFNIQVNLDMLLWAK